MKKLFLAALAMSLFVGCEDADAKFAPYTLDYCSKSIASWSDLVGDYGMNTPAYFAYDDVAVIF